MSTKHWIGTALCVGALAVAGTALQQDKTGEKKPAAPAAKPAAPAAAPSADEAAMMAKMMELGTPGPAHKLLDPKAGKWTAVVKMFQPGKPEPETSKASGELKWILDGRFLQENFEGDFMGMPFHGMGMVGYDNLKKKYVSTWVDNMGTGIMMGEGSYDEKSKSFNYTSEGPDMTTGKYVKERMVDKMVDADHRSLQMYQPGPDGKEFMMMEIDYTRAK